MPSLPFLPPPASKPQPPAAATLASKPRAMDSDQDSSASDDWVVLDSCTSSSSDDDLVLALSSGCATPTSSASDSDADRPATDLAAADEGFYAISDAEDDDDDADACPPPPAPVPMPLAGLFHHMVARGPRVSYAAFDPHHGAKRLVPGPTFSAFFHEAVSALASTRGLVCLRGERSKDYYVANPATFDRARLPRPNRDHFKRGDPAVVITFDLDNHDDHDDFDFDDRRVVYRHYRVVVAFHLGEGIYAFESFSSRTWSWTIGAGVVEAETVVPLSGVGALGCAFWRTTMGHFICFEPVSGCSDLVPAPMEVTEWPHWELGEMEGRLCATCTDDRVSAVVVICLDLAARRTDTGHVAWTLAGHFEGGCLRGRQDVTLLRSQGKAEVVMWDRRAEAVVAMDLEGRTTRTISMPSGTGYYADFIPYIATLAAVSAHSSNVPRKECPRTTGTNEMGAECRAMAVDAEAY